MCPARVLRPHARLGVLQAKSDRSASGRSAPAFGMPFVSLLPPFSHRADARAPDSVPNASPSSPWGRVNHVPTTTAGAGKRARSAAVHCTAINPSSSSSLENQSREDSDPHATVPQQQPSPDALHHDDTLKDYMRAVGGLMTDSVLELKWNAEARGQSWAHHAVPPHEASSSCGCDGEPQIEPLEDPARFYCFTRIAAPTALLEQASLEAEALRYSAEHAADDPGVVLDLPPPSTASVESNNSGTPTPNSSSLHVSSFPEPTRVYQPYGAAALAQRMVRRMHAKQNLDEFLQYFQGEFDNYQQIASQRKNGILPREGGGHEHIHCSLRVLGEDMLFARYYFNGNPAVVFRSRLYRVYALDSSDRGLLEMRIFRFDEEAERKLKASNFDIDAFGWRNARGLDQLDGCEVFWERYEPPTDKPDTAVQELGIKEGTRFVGFMKGGGCEVYSREIKGRIRVMDDLLLTLEDLWVSDRGFDETGHFVYGNRKGEPYKMKRVQPDGPMAWTLSAAMPPPEGYQS